MRGAACLALLCAVGWAGCGRGGDSAGSARSSAAAAGPGRTAVTLQTDWYPQPEHGGFYQAMARGFFAEAGLDVTILPGGPRALVLQKVGMGQVPLALWRSDDVTVAVSRGVPIVCLAGIFQRDPQAIMFHAGHPVRDFRDLEGRVVMAGAGSVWVEFVERRYGISIQRTPVTFSVAQFLLDPMLVQQCMVTSEPYQARKAGAEVGTLLVAEAGFEPYHALVANREWLTANRAAAEAFVRASLRGWRDFLEADPRPAFELIARLNPQHEASSLAYSREQMIGQRLIAGNQPGQRMGALDRGRLESQARTLYELGIAERLVPAAELTAPGFPPE